MAPSTPSSHSPTPHIRAAPASPLVEGNEVLRFADLRLADLCIGENDGRMSSHVDITNTASVFSQHHRSPANLLSPAHREGVVVGGNSDAGLGKALPAGDPQNVLDHPGAAVPAAADDDSHEHDHDLVAAHEHDTPHKHDAAAADADVAAADADAAAAADADDDDYDDDDYADDDDDDDDKGVAMTLWHEGWDPDVLPNTLGRYYVSLRALRVDGELILGKIFLPHDLETARQLSWDVWNDTVEGLRTQFEPLLKLSQRNALTSLAYVYVWFSRDHGPHDSRDIAALWEEVQGLLQGMATMGVVCNTPGEDLLFNLQLWARHKIEDALPVYLRSADAPRAGREPQRLLWDA